ncbi:MAG: hypothetical protein JO115_10290 [Pseudonocardiales bacterium]|nr:hypothetical protein [Pseudonocardiales bacterium]
MRDADGNVLVNIRFVFESDLEMLERRLPMPASLVVVRFEDSEAYAKASLKKYRPMAARNEDKKVFSGLL